MKPLKQTHGGGFESALADLDKAGRHRNFGAATKHMQTLRQLCKGLTPAVCLQYIKACLRCGQGSVAQAYRDYYINNFAANSSVKQKLKLESLFLRQAVEDLNMTEAYGILHDISTTGLDESHLQDWLRGALRSGWVFESFAILAAAPRQTWLPQTIESIIELLFTISSCKVAKSIAHIQKKWLNRSSKPSAPSEYLAKAQSKLLILLTLSQSRSIHPEEIAEVLAYIDKVDSKLQTESSSNTTHADHPKSDIDTSDSSLKFWKLKLHCMRVNLGLISKSERSEQRPVLFSYCAPDHVLRDFDYALWSNRAHADVWPALYDVRLLRPRTKPKKPGALRWPDAEALCKHCLARDDDAAAAAFTKILGHTVAAIITKKTHAPTPLLVELGAGDGITAIEMSRTAAVIVNELRWNRCASIVWRMGLTTDNQKKASSAPEDSELILGGDGTKVCQLYLQECCDEIQINFPEPPPNKENPDNWISPRLFETIWRSLRVDGKFKLVSDQRSLMEYIDAYIVKKLLTSNQWRQGLDQRGPETIWNFQLVTDRESLSKLNASFFGQLWSRGDKKTFHFELVKNKTT